MKRVNVMENVAEELIDLLKEYDIYCNVNIYLSDKCISSEKGLIYNDRKTWFKEMDNVLSMSFGEELKDVFENKYLSIFANKLKAIFKKYSCYYKVDEEYNHLAIYRKSITA